MGDFNKKIGTNKETNDFIHCNSTRIYSLHNKANKIMSTTAPLIDHLYSNHTHTNYDSGIIVTDMTDHFGIFHLV